MSDDKQKGALIFTHLQPEGSCMLGKTIADRGMRIRTINTPRRGSERGLGDIDPLRPDLLVIMGGPVGVYQADDYPILQEEMDIIKARIEADLPTVGICLGAQLIAASLGARVYQGGQGKEVGWNSLSLTNAGRKSPVRHLDGAKTNMFHWHGDTFDLPDDAMLLATSNLYTNQIFSYGKNILGIQCHPEVHAAQLEEWFVMFQRDITGDAPLLPVHELRAQTGQYIEKLNHQTQIFFNEWLEEAGL